MSTPFTTADRNEPAATDNQVGFIADLLTRRDLSALTGKTAERVLLIGSAIAGVTEGHYVTGELLADLGPGRVLREAVEQLILGRLTAVSSRCRSALRASMDRAGAPYPPRDDCGREVLDGEPELEALASVRAALDALTEAVTEVVEYRARGL